MTRVKGRRRTRTKEKVAKSSDRSFLILFLSRLYCYPVVVLLLLRFLSLSPSLLLSASVTLSLFLLLSPCSTAVQIDVNRVKTKHPAAALRAQGNPLLRVTTGKEAEVHTRGSAIEQQSPRLSRLPFKVLKSYAKSGMQCHF